MLTTTQIRTDSATDRYTIEAVSAGNHDRFAAEANPLIQKLLLARDAAKEQPMWQHA
jgi:hypothetical protein